MEFVLKGEDGRRLTLSNLAGTVEDLRFSARLDTETAHGSVGVWEYRCGVAAFIRELADAWKGFEGVKSYVSTERHLSLECSHDGLGTVRCEVVIGQLWDPVWSMSAVLKVGAGAHLETLAAETEAFFGDLAWPQEPSSQ